MGETLPLFTPLFNKSVQIESRPEHLTGESGALIQREIMERSGIIDWLAARPSRPAQARTDRTYPLSDLLRTHLLLLGQGWRDQDDADRLRQDPGLRWPIALAGEPRHWTKNMYWPHSPRFRGW